MVSKLCNTCNTVKSVNEFNKMAVSRDGCQSKCKVCNGVAVQNWNENNRDRLNECLRNRRVNNPQHRISNNMHRKLNHLLHRGIYSARTEQIIGLNKQTYLEWLSYNFEGEMCFATYGKVWQIDLIIPASAYDLTTEGL